MAGEPRALANDFVRVMFQCVRDPVALEHYVRDRLASLTTLANDVQWFEVTVAEYSGFGFRALITAYRQDGNVVAEHDNSNEFLAVRNTCELLAVRLQSAHTTVADAPTTSPRSAPMWAADPTTEKRTTPFTRGSNDD